MEPLGKLANLVMIVGYRCSNRAQDLQLCHDSRIYNLLVRYHGEPKANPFHNIRII